jgi:hypothetical protein
MKIGLIASAYNCAQFLEDCLKPWEILKKQSEHELCCSFIHNCFKENKELHLPIESSDGTAKILEQKHDDGTIDYYNFSTEYLREHEARNVCLKNVLQENVDYVWTLGLDELYTIDEIEKILAFVEANPFVDWFKINYKNYIFDGKQWVDGFCPPRIFKVNTHAGLKELYYDDDFIYTDGSDYKKLSNLEVPKVIAHVKHMTWLHSNGKAKVEYQKLRWGDNGCSYSWDYKENKLKFNENFYKITNKPLPIINYE